MITHTSLFLYDARFGFVSFMAAFIWAVFAVKRLWHVLRQTFSDLPSSAISAAKRCSVLHCSGPAPTRHECQTASKVNFLLLTFICSTFQCFPFYFITTAHTVAAAVSLFSLICFTVTSVASFEVKRPPPTLPPPHEPCQHSSCSVGYVTHRVGVGEIRLY